MNQRTITIPRWSAAAVLLPLLILVGVIASPRDADMRPLLLSPAVQETLIYQNAARRWSNQFQELDSSISMVLEGSFGNDLYSKAEKVNRALGDATRLYKEIERQETPSAALPLRSILVDTASAYLDAARATLLWATAGNNENKNTADTALNAARAHLKELEASSWLTNLKP